MKLASLLYSSSPTVLARAERPDNGDRLTTPVDLSELGLEPRPAPKTDKIMGICERCSGTGKCGVCWGAGNLMAPILQKIFEEAEQTPIPPAERPPSESEFKILRQCTMCNGGGKCYFCSGTGKI